MCKATMRTECVKSLFPNTFFSFHFFPLWICLWAGYQWQCFETVFFYWFLVQCYRCYTDALLITVQKAKTKQHTCICVLYASTLVSKPNDQIPFTFKESLDNKEMRMAHERKKKVTSKAKIKKKLLLKTLKQKTS